MSAPDAAFLDAVTARVKAIEQRTDAEIVVVFAGRADAWRDRVELTAAVGGLSLGALLLVIPWMLHPAAFVVDQALAWLLLRWLLGRPALLAPLLALTDRSHRERRRRAERAAGEELLAEAVHATPNRTGVLIYVAALEDEVVVLPDLGVQGMVPGGELMSACRTFRGADHAALLAGMDAVASVLERHVPLLPHSDETDLPNEPRVRP